MSKKKRRKISKKKSEIFDLSTFQTELSEIIPSALFVISESNVWIRRNKKYELSDNEKYSGLEKQAKILVGGVSFLQYDLMDRMKVKPLQKIYRKFIEGGKCPSKGTIVKVLALKFFGQKTEADKRNEEKKMIEDSKLDQLFVTMAGITIPKEIIDHIIRYMKVGPNLLYDSVGSVCKDFYVAVLTNWGNIRIMRNVRKVSLLALSSAREVSFFDKLVTKDYTYLWSNLNSNKLQKLDVLYYRKQDEVKRFLNSLMGRSFPNLTCIKLGEIENRSFFKEMEMFDFSEFAPNLKKIVYPYSLGCLRNCKKIEDLKVSLDHLRCFNISGFKVEDFKENVSENLKKLDLHIVLSDHDFIGLTPGKIKMILTNFKKLETLCLDLRNCKDLQSFDYLTELPKLKNLNFPFHLSDYQAPCIPIRSFTTVIKQHDEVNMIKSRFQSLKRINASFSFSSDQIKTEILNLIFGDRIKEFEVEITSNKWNKLLMQMKKRRKVLRVEFEGKGIFKRDGLFFGKRFEGKNKEEKKREKEKMEVEHNQKCIMGEKLLCDMIEKYCGNEYIRSIIIRSKDSFYREKLESEKLLETVSKQLSDRMKKLGFKLTDKENIFDKKKYGQLSNMFSFWLRNVDKFPVVWMYFSKIE